MITSKIWRFIKNIMRTFCSPLVPLQWSSDVSFAHCSLFQTDRLHCRAGHQTLGLQHACSIIIDVSMYFSKAPILWLTSRKQTLNLYTILYTSVGLLLGSNVWPQIDKTVEKKLLLCRISTGLDFLSPLNETGF